MIVQKTGNHNSSFLGVYHETFYVFPPLTFLSETFIFKKKEKKEGKNLFMLLTKACLGKRFEP